MMKNLLLLTLLIFICCTSRHRNSLEIGDTFEGRVDSTKNILRNSGSIDKAYFVTINNIAFGFCKNKDGVVNYIFCDDAEFSTDGVKVGDSYSKLITLTPNAMVHKERGWALYVDLPSGWEAGFGLPDEYMNTTRIEDTATVKSFFKR